jgi:hypothetical protein
MSCVVADISHAYYECAGGLVAQKFCLYMS